MNKKQLLLLILLLFIASNGFALPAKLNWNRLPIEKDTRKYENKEYKTSDEYVQAFYEGKCSSVWIWMHIKREDKIKLIDGLKQMFKEKDNVTINQSSEYYVDEIDRTMANNPEEFEQYKLGVIFKTIAVMDYDFDEGIDKAETARKWLGPAYLDIVKGMMGVR
jgi:hypothetical protein